MIGVMEEGILRNPLLLLQLHHFCSRYNRSWSFSVGVLAGGFKPTPCCMISPFVILNLGLIRLGLSRFSSIFCLCRIQSFLLPHPMLWCIDALVDFLIRPPCFNNAHGGVFLLGNTTLIIWTFGFLLWTFGSLFWTFWSVLWKEEGCGYCIDGVNAVEVWWRQVTIAVDSRFDRGLKLPGEIAGFSLVMYAMHLLSFLVIFFGCVLFVSSDSYE